MIQRVTRQRTAVAEALIALDDFRSAQQLHEYLRAHGDSIGLATVYRTLQSLAEAHQVDVIRTGEGESLYRRCERRDDRDRYVQGAHRQPRGDRELLVVAHGEERRPQAHADHQDEDCE
ncbi:MAG TPA: transcriptional repressor, partial [Cellulomonas sp.]